jgi:hypothetical protein
MTMDPFLENSQMVASDAPDMRHLPTMEEFPQPTIADTKTARTMISNRGLYRIKMDCTMVGIVSWAGVINATCSVAIQFDAIKPFFTLRLLRPQG